MPPPPLPSARNDNFARLSDEEELVPVRRDYPLCLRFFPAVAWLAWLLGIFSLVVRLLTAKHSHPEEFGADVAQTLAGIVLATLVLTGCLVLLEIARGIRRLGRR